MIARHCEMISESVKRVSDKEIRGMMPKPAGMFFDGNDRPLVHITRRKEGLTSYF